MARMMFNTNLEDRAASAYKLNVICKALAIWAPFFSPSMLQEEEGDKARPCRFQFFLTVFPCGRHLPSDDEINKVQCAYEDRVENSLEEKPTMEELVLFMQLVTNEMRQMKA